MADWKSWVQKRPFCVLDGGIGSWLLAEGGVDIPPELFNLRQPEQVKAMHRAFVQAGARIILTNTFGGNRYRLALAGLADVGREVNQTAVFLARQVASEAETLTWVAGSIGPFGGEVSTQTAVSLYAEQARWLEEAGVDLLWLETMSDLTQAETAVQGVRAVSQLPVVLTASFHQGATITPKALAELARHYQLAATGINCGEGPHQTPPLIATLRHELSDLPLVSKPNAGLPQRENGRLIYPLTPTQMAEWAVRAYTNGATLIGGCCGATPEHIAAIHTALTAHVSPGEYAD